MKTVHMCMSVKGVLKNWRPSQYRKFFTNDNGRVLTADEAKRYLLDEIGKGRLVIPMGECDNFDYQTGCRGHEDVTEKGDTNGK